MTQKPSSSFSPASFSLSGHSGRFGQRHFVRLFRHDFAEQAHLSALFIAPGALPGFHGAFHGGEFLRAMPCSESMAPARIRLSIMRRLTAPSPTFSQN